jgi:hypothetical protein
MRLIALVASALIGAACSFSAMSAPPYDITATFTAAPNATSHRLYRGCRAGETKALVGTVTSGQTFTGLLTAQGEYSFCVHGVNSAGEGPSSNIAVVNVTDLPDVPGAPSNFTITLTCQQHPSGLPSCAVTVQTVPAP